MAALEEVHPAYELVSPIPIAPGGSEDQIRVLRAALGLKSEIDRIDCAIISDQDESIAMPNQPIYGAGDVSVTATKLRSICAIMYEVNLSPDITPINYRPRSYQFVLTLQLVGEGVRLYRDSSRHVVVRVAGEDSDVPVLMEGSEGMRAQELILGRAARQLKEQRLARTSL